MIANKCLVWVIQVVVPKNFHSKILNLYMKVTLVCVMCIDDHIEIFVNACRISSQNARDPVKVKLPSQPFQRLSLDFAGPYSYVTEFWKITHMSVHEIIRIFVIDGFLLRAEHTFKKYFKTLNFLRIKVIKLQIYTIELDSYFVE